MYRYIIECEDKWFALPNTRMRLLEICRIQDNQRFVTRMQGIMDKSKLQAPECFFIDEEKYAYPVGYESLIFIMHNENLFGLDDKLYSVTKIEYKDKHEK